MLGCEFDGEGLLIPFYHKHYRVCCDAISDTTTGDETADFSVKIILLKYILNCPQKYGSTLTGWLSYKDFKDSGPLVGYFTSNALAPIQQEFSNKGSLLKKRGLQLGAKLENAEGYDLSLSFNALPRIPVMLHFNEADEMFNASLTILFKATAQYFLDMECLAMVGSSLSNYLLPSKHDEPL